MHLVTGTDGPVSPQSPEPKTKRSVSRKASWFGTSCKILSSAAAETLRRVERSMNPQSVGELRGFWAAGGDSVAVYAPNLTAVFTQKRA